MYSRKLLRAQIQVERFLAKAARRNDPLEKYRQQEPYLAFENKAEEIIADQIRWTANHLGEMKIGTDDLEPHVIEARVATYLDRHMPTFASKMPYDTVYDNLKAAFEWSCKAAYRRMGVRILKKAVDYTVDFELTNQDYLDSLADDAKYLLNTKSTAYDQTTKDRLVNIVRDGRLNRDTIDDISSDILADDAISGISSVRSFMIANTETANAFGNANQAMLEENNIPKKSWIIAGPHNLTDECDDNADASPIDSGEEFPSGDLSEPAHPNCECYTEGEGLDLTTMSNDELDSLVLWDGS